MSRPRWAELVRNCPHGVSAPNRAHLASLLTPVPFPVFWQVCSDPIQPVFQGEASSVGPGDAKVTTLPSPPPSAWPDLLSRARLCSGVYTLDKVGKGPGGVPAKSTLPLSPALRDASGDRFCLDGLVEPSPEGPLHLARLGDGECLKPGRAGTQPPWEAQPSHPGYSESGLRPQPPWEAQPSHPSHPESGLPWEAQPSPPRHPESGLGLNHPGKPSLPIPAIPSLGCLRVFDLPGLGKGDGGRAPFYLQGPEPPACLPLRAPCGRCWVQTSILPTLTDGCIDAGGGV